jgi:hypothetical protein
MTVWGGQLVWSCRLEELKAFGNWVRTVPNERINDPRAPTSGVESLGA